ncbi:Uncharacterised protein [Mycobacteroides abscessus]|uniref:hypothetical protein n=1 Tax=Mycobacteroides abscessus TaxID=36809 RepID=UPI0005E63F7D|nr:hypothetical protein [Mycobacteroides abscessus]CPX20633.1 Uncharacterised protein [Mycobacteroides abscessus]CRG61231.1 Uncharacterised protein [Mycobacteroides abscessus]
MTTPSTPTVVFREPRAPHAPRHWRTIIGVGLVAIAVLAGVFSLLGASMQPSGRDGEILATRCTPESHALSDAEKQYGAKSASARSARNEYNDCIIQLKALQSDKPKVSAAATNASLSASAWFGGIGILLLVGQGTRVTDLGEFARVKYRAARRLPARDATIELPTPTAPVVQQTVTFEPETSYEPVVDYPEDEGDADAQDVDAPTERARAGWGSGASRRVEFGDEEAD